MNNVIFMRANIFRNVKDYKFTHKLDAQKAQEIEEKVTTALGSSFHKINLSSADLGVINYLKDNALIGKNTKTLLVNKDNTLSVSLFEDEHIHIRSTAHGFDKQTILNATNLVNALANKLSLTFSDEFGYLMSNLSLVGTGLKLECDMDLNAIVGIGKIEQIKQNVKKLGLTLVEKEANIFTLSTNCNLGFTENEIIDEFEKMVQKLQEVELESAKMLYASKHDEVMDRTLRGYGILTSAYLMSAEELKRLISILRTGLNVGILEIDTKKLNSLQKLVVNKNSQFTSQSELISLAENVRKILKGE